MIETEKGLILKTCKEEKPPEKPLCGTGQAQL